MSLDTTMVSIHPHFTIKDGKMDQCIALLEEILVLTKADEPDCLFFNITTCGSNKAYVREAYKDCLLYTSPSPRDATLSRMPSSA